LLEEESIVESSSRDYVEQAIAFLESESLPAQEDVETLAADVEAAHLVEEGRVLAQRGSWDDAWDKFTEAGLIDPDHFGVLANKAWWKKEVSFLRDSSKIKEPASLDEADDLCSKALKIKSDSKGLWNLKSAIALGMGQLKDAEAASREALKIDPNYPPASSGLAKILAMQHKFTEALRVAKEGAQFQEQTGKRGKYQCDIWQTLASLQLYLGERGALESANKAHDVYRRDTRNWLIRARIHLTVAEHLDAAEALLNAHGAANFTTLREPKFKRILAQAQLRNGYYQDAILNASAAMEEGDLPVVCHLIKAVAHANMGERADAANELGEAHEHWPEQFDAGDDVIVTAEKGLLWFDTRAELIQLRREATELISAP
jgi:tetratricopeptide (TPR) repeat protein